MQCRRGYHGGIILKDVSLFVFLPPKNTVSESVQICKFLHSLLSEPLHGSGRRAHAVRNFAPGLLLEIKGEFPSLHEVITFQQYKFEVLEMDARRIVKVKVTIEEKTEKDDDKND